jgi:hypothetical protein
MVKSEKMCNTCRARTPHSIASRESMELGTDGKRIKTTEQKMNVCWECLRPQYPNKTETELRALLGQQADERLRQAVRRAKQARAEGRS